MFHISKVTDISPESELDDVRFKVNMRTSLLNSSAEKVVDIESGGAKQTDSSMTANRRQSIISGIDAFCIFVELDIPRCFLPKYACCFFITCFDLF